MNCRQLQVLSSNHCKSDLDCIGPTTTTNTYPMVLSSVDALSCWLSYQKLLAGSFPSRRSQDSSCQIPNNYTPIGAFLDIPTWLCFCQPSNATESRHRSDVLVVASDISSNLFARLYHTRRHELKLTSLLLKKQSRARRRTASRS